MIDNLTIGQYQELYAISKENIDDIDKSTQSVAVVTGKTEREIEEMPWHEFQTLSKSVVTAFEKARLRDKPKSFLRSGKKLYQVNFKPSTLRAAQYIEVQTWLKDKDAIIVNMHMILASISVRVRNYYLFKLPIRNDSTKHAEMAEDFKSVKFSDAYGCVVFFCKLLDASIKGLQIHLEKKLAKELSRAKKVMKKIPKDTLKSFGLDGFTQPPKSQSSSA